MGFAPALMLTGLLAAGSLHVASPAWPPIAVAKEISPSVVGILNLQGSPDGPMLTRGSGSGLIVRRDGYIVTNDHVVSGASKLRVMLPDGKSFPAAIVGEDPLTDLAVVKIPAQGLPASRLASKHIPTVGELAIAIGNPMGLGFARSVTVGVVSGIDRSLGQGYAQRAYGLIQTDAAINPGNSGGPLCDAQGDVIGLNSVKINSFGFESMGFAIPAPLVEKVAQALIRDGKVARPWMGISATDAPGQKVNGHVTPGIGLTAVAPYGPAARADLRPHDVLLTLNGRPLPNLSALYRLLADLSPGDKVQVTLSRGGTLLSRVVVLEAMPEHPQVS